MNAKRAAMSPPDLPGFTYLEVLGSGGFADVYLYEQELPKRRVAVKVLLTERMSSGSVAEFTAEANVMAMLSTHPAIVTIYQAGVSRDGRPYLVMEYCPKPNLQARYRRDPFSVAEALRVGVQVAAAVETAHRAGVLHRDIKPANILVTEYNRPALTDFGIASTTSAAAESAGLSIPWSPPESFADVPRSDPRSDVWALGATVYTLLSGHSPFELPGERNTAADLIQRIERLALPALARADVPASLQHTLAQAMSKSSPDRYESALAFARALQKVQIELSHSVTPIDILDDAVVDEVEDDEDDGLTRVRGVVSIAPETRPAAGPTQPSAAATPAFRAQPVVMAPRVDAPADTVRRDASAAGSVDDTLRPGAAYVPAAPAAGASAAFGAGAGTVDETIVRASAAFDAATVPAPPRAKSRTPLVVGIVAGVIALIVVIVVAVSLPALLGGTPDPAATPPATSDPKDPISVVVPQPADLVGTAGPDGVVFTWTNPDPQEGDRYQIGVLTLGGDEVDYQPVTETSAVVPADPSGRTCVKVMTVRANGAYSEAVQGCTP